MIKQKGLQNKKISYTWRKSRRARHMRLAVYPGGRVVVTTPFYFPEYLMKKFLEKKAHWLQKKVSWFRQWEGRILPGGNKKDYLENKNKALVLAKNRIEHFNKIYNFSYQKIGIRNQKTRWGSCSKKGNLSFNYKIIFLPEKMADYIIVHELCHLSEFNHSKNFWRLVAKTLPDYLAIRRDLRKRL